MVNTDPVAHADATPGSRDIAGVEPALSQLVAELASAGLVRVEVGDDGGTAFVLTRQGQRVARLMAMSRDGHALILLGALVGTSDGPN